MPATDEYPDTNVCWSLATENPDTINLFDSMADRPPEMKSDTLSKTFDEEKCRNVLVRYCAHIPRNYQYKDGIQLVFLVLRDHLGDELLGRAGGVLYEMIEVDCQHTDDKGAAFQRWRHDHMNRHEDLELPHVPHLTTVTSAIIPTTILARWRAAHPQRYSTRLSDHCSPDQQTSPLPGYIRNKKDWSIDYTMYISTRDAGTKPFRRIQPQQYHEVLWDCVTEVGGKFIGEKSIDLPRSVSRDVSASENFELSSSVPKRRNLIISSCIFRRCSKSGFFAKNTSSRRTSQDAMIGSGRLDLLGLTQEADTSTMSAAVTEPEIPNANFARKFGIFADAKSLPQSIRELPVAEDKAMDVLIKSSVRELMSSRRFRGPFTPQLWFDSGLDYRKTTQ